MPNADETVPPDEWLAATETARAKAEDRTAESDLGGIPLPRTKTPSAASARPQSGNQYCEPPPESTIEDAFRLAQSLGADDRLKLVARLWSSLPPDHRAALVTLQLEDARQPADSRDPFDGLPETTVEPIWPVVSRFLFDPATTSELYSAPRRFDLATIFVVTAAYSLLFGGLTALDASPAVKIILGGVVTIVAAAQALFLQVANPRGVSIVAGAVAYTFFSWILWFVDPSAFPVSFLFVTVFNGMIGGAILGYLAGVMVGGVFLVADILRQKYHPDSVDRDTDADESSVGEAN